MNSLTGHIGDAEMPAISELRFIKMSNTYSIYLTNRYGSNQTYGFFMKPPERTGASGTVCSTVWISKNLAYDGAYEVNLTKTIYAWCGKSPETLSPGVKVSWGNSRAAVLGEDRIPGSTFTMYNNGGDPAFKDLEKATADDSCYEIESSSDFTANLNFLMGMSAPDDNGRIVPVACFEAPPSAKVNIKPQGLCYVAAFATHQGTAIDYKVESSRNCGLIDFSAYPGEYGAIVTHMPDGRFDVKYTSSRGEFLFRVGLLKQTGLPLQQQVDALSSQLSKLTKQITTGETVEAQADGVANAMAAS
ncbi:MAG: hypothetical protein M1828_007321 [Chrysothrix sp. TS-e1954]|nr:MAG: hypothetical protein M1828_007321 [Chrysothrix sp. TS-e1954]